MEPKTILEKATGESVDHLRQRTIEESRDVAKKRDVRPMRVVSKFQFAD